jgi:hypothetical protein
MMTAKRLIGLSIVAALAAAFAVTRAGAVTLDDRGEMRLGLRAYTAARIGTEKMGGESDPLSFPRSPAGHLRQHRYFLELKLDHDLRRLAKTSWGLAALFRWLDPSSLRYALQYRGEGEGLYDYGPHEFTDQFTEAKKVRLDVPDIKGLSSPILPDQYIHQRVNHLRNNARMRHRFFIGYFDYEQGPVFVRVGRQVLAWGETDQFRLLDNINPLDQGFGGFFIPLDERRVPLDMLRTSYHFASIGPVTDAYLEGFGAMGNRVSVNPGVPQGSPWEPGGLSFPNPAVRFRIKQYPPEDFRFGARFVFNYRDVTYSLAHYYTRLDTPGVRFRIPGAFKGINTPRFGNEIIADVITPRVPISGGSLTFPVPSWYTIVRSEAAFIQREPLNRAGRGSDAESIYGPGTKQFNKLLQQKNTEGGLDPFLYPSFFDLARKKPIQGTLLRRDTFNWATGLDVNRFVRWINPTQTLFFSTQLFYKHVFNSPGDLILPVVHHDFALSTQIPIAGTGCGGAAKRPCEVRPRFLHLNDDQFLQTLLASTSYYGGRVQPQFVVAYDWQGVVLTQPGVTLVRDPFRLVFDYTRIDGAASGQIGALRDRDNVRFQAEYVF